MTVSSESAPRRRSVDRLGIFICAIAGVGLFMPFVTFRANRIVAGEAHVLTEALPGWQGYGLMFILALAAVAATAPQDSRTRLIEALAALLFLAVGLGLAANALTPPGDKVSRISPAVGFWLEMLAFGLLASDAVSRLALRPFARLGLLCAVSAAIAAILLSGLWNEVSVLREYANRTDTFWREAGTHVGLALGSLAVAFVVGLPLGLAVHPTRHIRRVLLNTLNAVQTIPSIALFGLLIAPLAWIAAMIPGAAALGIAGIGIAPAMVALFLYSLMPVVSNVLSGLDGVPPSANEAARGMGMTDLERLLQVQLPLAFPSILAAIRIVLVQNIGLATVAALIGGGGLGVFVFQGVGQTAMDLVLLGAVPTVALAFVCAVILDAAVEMVSVGGHR
jgi:osmoprotectant transport system permease protein